MVVKVFIIRFRHKQKYLKEILVIQNGHCVAANDLTTMKFCQRVTV
jgi:hypothetical protein